MSDPVDPEDLPRSFQPSDVTVRTREQPVFVADATVQDVGWLSTTDWEGNRLCFPPTQVIRVDRHDTESYDIAEEPDRYKEAHRLADPELRDYAAAATSPTDSREAPADD